MPLEEKRVRLAVETEEEIMNYIDYIMETAQKLLAIPSPAGFTHRAAEFVIKELRDMGYAPKKTTKGAVLVDLGGGVKSASDSECRSTEGRTADLQGSSTADFIAGYAEGSESSPTNCAVAVETCNDPLLLAAHMDTLGAMVEQIKSNGHLKLTRIGGLMPNNTEGENCHVYTRDGRVFDATFQLENPSVHVNGEYSEKKRSYDSMEAIVDELVSTKEEVEALGIMNGDFVCFEPRTVVTASGFIKSRFLDDKFSSCILLAYAKYLKDQQITPQRHVYLLFTTYEEVGHGCSASVPEEVKEILCVDMGCVGDGLECDETKVSICAKDSHGPYDYTVVSNLVRAAREAGVAFAVDVYPHYGSDADAALTAGHDVRHGLIGPGVFASHGYERSHRLGAENTFRLLCAYLG